MNEEQYQLAYQAEQMQKILESIDAQISEVNSTIAFLEDFKNTKGNEEILFPIANGMFARGKLLDNKNLKVNVGNNVVVEKTIDQAIEMMKKQHEDIFNYRSELLKQLEGLLGKIQK
ncbi:MAG: prefoldin subunit alpha [Candidatus Woesearchaeota archaeon]